MVPDSLDDPHLPWGPPTPILPAVIQGLLLWLDLLSGDLGIVLLLEPPGASPVSLHFPAARKLVQLGLCLLSAPEMVKGEPIGSATDIWGVGVLTYII